jgi:5-methylcytosine-specific restriction protein A
VPSKCLTYPPRFNRTKHSFLMTSESTRRAVSGTLLQPPVRLRNSARPFWHSRAQVNSQPTGVKSIPMKRSMNSLRKFQRNVHSPQAEDRRSRPPLQSPISLIFRHRGLAHHAAYKSRAWTDLRKRVLREEPVCAEEGCQERSTTVDHIVPLADGGQPYDRANVRGMCYPHHKARSSRLGAEARKRNQQRRREKK